MSLTERHYQQLANPEVMSSADFNMLIWTLVALGCCIVLLFLFHEDTPDDDDPPY